MKCINAEKYDHNYFWHRNTLANVILIRVSVKREKANRRKQNFIPMFSELTFPLPVGLDISKSPKQQVRVASLLANPRENSGQRSLQVILLSVIDGWGSIMGHSLSSSSLGIWLRTIPRRTRFGCRCCGCRNQCPENSKEKRETLIPGMIMQSQRWVTEILTK